MTEHYTNDVFWVKLGRILLTAGCAIGVMLILAGPAIGWWVDTRVFPGQPDSLVRLHDDTGAVVDTYRDTQDTYSTTLWLLVPYSIYLFSGLVAASIAIGVAVRDATGRLHMDSVYDTLPVNPKDKQIESENPDVATRAYDILPPDWKGDKP